VGNQVRWTDQTVNASRSLAVRFSVTVSLTTSVVAVTNAAYGVICAEGVSAASTPVTPLANPY
jgi:hypothetical protein